MDIADVVDKWMAENPWVITEWRKSGVRSWGITVAPWLIVACSSCRAGALAKCMSYMPSVLDTAHEDTRHSRSALPRTLVSLVN